MAMILVKMEGNLSIFEVNEFDFEISLRIRPYRTPPNGVKP